MQLPTTRQAAGRCLYEQCPQGGLMSALCLPLLATYWSWLAWRRRQAGRYDRYTLTLYWRAWHHTGRPAALLRWLRFRHDLGWPLPRRWYGVLAGAQMQRALAGQGSSLAELCDHSAPAMQARRQDFAAWLRQRLADAPPGTPGVMVVGNAAGLQARALGQHIDAHAVVLRFNHWRGEASSNQDTGQRLDVWMVAPHHSGPVPAGLRWAVVSGADPQHRMQRWPVVQALVQAGVPVLTVPLPVWAGLVQQLQAPPSAGLLALAWLHQLTGTWQGLNSAGIGWGQRADGQHHLVQHNRQTSTRHNWQAEAMCVERWHLAGLSRMH